MPNICSNALQVTPLGEEHAEEFNKFVQYLKRSQQKYVLMFSTFLPQPQDIVNSVGIEYRVWRTENWGCDRDVNWAEVTFKDIDNGISLIFDSAWAPPLVLVQTLSQQNPNFNFLIAYSESGMQYAGTSEFQNGEMISQEEFKALYKDVDLDAEGFVCEDHWQEFLDKYGLWHGG